MKVVIVILINIYSIKLIFKYILILLLTYWELTYWQLNLVRAENIKGMFYTLTPEKHQDQFIKLLVLSQLWQVRKQKVVQTPLKKKKRSQIWGCLVFFSINDLTGSFLACMFFHSIIFFQVQYKSLAQQI